MVVVCNIRMARVFVTIIADEKSMNKQKIKEYELVHSLNVPMYAIVKEGISWDCIRHLPWKKVYYAKSPQDVPALLGIIDADVGGGLHYT